MTNKNYTIEEFTELLSTATSYSYSNYKGPVTKELEVDEDPYSLETAQEFYHEVEDYTLNLEDGTVVFVHHDENSLQHDGAEIGIIFEYGDQIFRYFGSYSSHDSDYWEELIEVQKEIRMVPQFLYHPKRKNQAL